MRVTRKNSSRCASSCSLKPACDERRLSGRASPPCPLSGEDGATGADRWCGLGLLDSSSSSSSSSAYSSDAAAWPFWSGLALTSTDTSSADAAPPTPMPLSHPACASFSDDADAGDALLFMSALMCASLSALVMAPLGMSGERASGAGWRTLLLLIVTGRVDATTRPRGWLTAHCDADGQREALQTVSRRRRRDR